ncbi:UMP kinase [soil metagenome]
MNDTARRPAYKRILLKLSGEQFTGDGTFGIDPRVLDEVAVEISEIVALNVEVGVVIGGGNLFRGRSLSAAGLDRVTADQMGMLATIMNGLALRDALERKEISTRIMSAIQMSGIVDQYDRRKAIHHLNKGRIVIFAAGTGNPFVTTDSAASLRAIETHADLLLKATNVDGVYTADPAKVPTATRYDLLTYQEALEKELGIMDLSAFCQCRDHDIKLRVFRMSKKGALLRIVLGEDEGTLVQNENSMRGIK